MLLFKSEHVEPILSGQKTQTRRTWAKSRVKVDAEHGCYTRLPITGAKPFARVLIKSVRQERLGDVSVADAHREGYRTRDAFIQAFAMINGYISVAEARELVVWVVDFWVVDFELVR